MPWWHAVQVPEDPISNCSKQNYAFWSAALSISCCAQCDGMCAFDLMSTVLANTLTGVFESFIEGVCYHLPIVSRDF